MLAAIGRRRDFVSFAMITDAASGPRAPWPYTLHEARRFYSFTAHHDEPHARGCYLFHINTPLILG